VPTVHRRGMCELREVRCGAPARRRGTACRAVPVTMWRGRVTSSLSAWYFAVSPVTPVRCDRRCPTGMAVLYHGSLARRRVTVVRPGSQRRLTESASQPCGASAGRGTVTVPHGHSVVTAVTVTVTVPRHGAPARHGVAREAQGAGPGPGGPGFRSRV
jgi:hypothetical protein